MSSKEKPYILFVAEKIYQEIQKIKKKNPDFSNIDAIDNFIGSKTYNEIMIVDNIMIIGLKNLRKTIF